MTTVPALVMLADCTCLEPRIRAATASFVSRSRLLLCIGRDRLEHCVLVALASYGALSVHPTIIASSDLAMSSRAQCSFDTNVESGCE